MIEISDDIRISLLQTLAARINTPQHVKEVSPWGRPLGRKSPGSGIQKGVRVFDLDRKPIGEWDSSREAAEALNTPQHRIKVACQNETKFRDMNKVEYYAEYFELPKKAVEA